MKLTREFVDEHIRHWEDVLRQSPRPHRAKWPSRLFHHAPVENAALILKSSQLLSRNHSDGKRMRDVADSDVLQSRDRPHEFARFYFRPRTPTQFRIEGIRKSEDSKILAAHAPVLVMFIFDARKVLIQPGVRFSDGNMQSSSTIDSDKQIIFKSIDWPSVYHEGPTSERSIIARRCAEVLCPSPYVIVDTLQWIYCRSEAERRYLFHLLGDAAEKWRAKIMVSDDILVFEKRHTYLEDISITSNGVVFSIHPAASEVLIDFDIKVFNSAGEELINRQRSNIPPTPPGKTHWIVRHPFQSGDYRVSITIENCLAFEGILHFEEQPF